MEARKEGPGIGFKDWRASGRTRRILFTGGGESVFLRTHNLSPPALSTVCVIFHSEYNFSFDAVGIYLFNTLFRLLSKSIFHDRPRDICHNATVIEITIFFVPLTFCYYHSRTYNILQRSKTEDKNAIVINNYVLTSNFARNEHVYVPCLKGAGKNARIQIK